MDVRLFDKEADQDQLDAFNTKIFGAASVPRKSEQIPRTNPYSTGHPVTAIAVHEGAIVGHLTSTPYALWVQGEEHLAYWVSGFHVLPDTRGMGVGKKLVACLNSALQLSSAVVVVEPSLQAFRSNGWVWPGLINDYVHIANPRTFLSILTVERIERFLPKGTESVARLLIKLMRFPMEWVINAVHSLLDIPGKIEKAAALGFEQVDEFGSEIDALWERTKNHYQLTHVRNAENLNWQFPTEMGWNKFVCRTEDEQAVEAWGLYTVKRYADGGLLDGLVALNIIDAFWDIDEPEVLAELIQHVLYLGYGQKVDLIMMSGNLPELKRVLRKSAFIKIPSTVHVGFSDQKFGEEGGEAIYSNSYITRGYADAAGGLGP